MPNVSYCVDRNEVHYTPYVPPYQGFCKLTLNNGSVVELEGSGELTSTMISSRRDTCISAEIGELCTSIGERAFLGWSGLTNVTIPNSVTSIGSGAFQNCSSLTSIDIPNGVTNIGDSFFEDCYTLSSVTIPSSVTSIGAYAFRTCTSLTNVTIPSSVTSIGKNAFRNCSSLTSITSLATTAPLIQSSTFRDVKSGGTLTVPIGSSGYDVWMGTGDYYLGKYNWTKVEQ